MALRKNYTGVRNDQLDDAPEYKRHINAGNTDKDEEEKKRRSSSPVRAPNGKSYTGVKKDQLDSIPDYTHRSTAQTGRNNTARTNGNGVLRTVSFGLRSQDDSTAKKQDNGAGTTTYAGLQEQLKQAERELARANALNTGFQRGMTGQSASGQAEMARRRKENEENIRALQQEIARLKGRIGEAYKAKEGKAAREETARVSDLPDFDQYVQAGRTAQTGAELSDLWKQDEAAAKRAVEYLTADENARMMQSGRKLMSGAEPYTDANLDAMTGEEARVLFYYAGKGDWESAGKYLKSLEPTLNERRQTAASEKAAQTAQEHPLAGAAANIGASYASPLAYLATAGQMVKNAVTGEYVPVDVNSPWFAGAHLTDDTQQGVHNWAYEAAGGNDSKKSRFGISWADVAAFAADTGLSIAQFASKAPLGATGSLAWIGAGAGGQETLSALERGATNEQALARGTQAGLIEIITEKIPIDNLFRLAKTAPGSVRGAVAEVLRQAGTEATEEMISEVANNLSDIAVMGESSEYRAYINELMQKGYSEEEAKKEAFFQFFVLNTLASGAGGGLSGGFMGSFATGAGYLSDAPNRRADSAIDTAYDVMQEHGMFSDQAGRANETASADLAKARERSPVYIDARRAEAEDAWRKQTNAEVTDDAEYPPVDRDRSSTDGFSRAPEGYRSAQDDSGRQDSGAAARGFAEKYGYGEHGRSVLNEMIESGSVSPDAVNQAFHLPYLWGMSNKARSEVELLGPIQEEAFNAGRLDRILSMKRSADTVTVWGKKSGLVENDLTKKLPRQTRESLHAMGSALGAKIVVEHIPAEQNANGYYKSSDGTIHIDADTTDPVMTVAKHEITHRMQELAPEAYTQFRDYAVQMENQGAETGNLSAVEVKQEQYRQASGGRVDLAVEAAMDEIAANYTEKILRDEKTLHDFVREMSETEEKRSVGQKFFDAVHEFLRKLKEHFGKGKKARAKMDAEAVDAFGATVSELERAERLWKKAYGEAVQAAESKAGQAQKSTAQTDGEVQYDLKDAEVQKNISEYRHAINAWNQSGRPDGDTFILGVTGDVLQGLGAIESDIYILSEKLNKIMHDHPEMTLEEIKRIPEILEDPVLILESRNAGRGAKQNTRMVLFGSVKAQNGKPVLSVLDIRPSEKKLFIDDMQKVTSAYTKDTDPVGYVSKSNVMYADKKRTIPLLRSIGFQMPIELLRSGSIGNISYFQRSVKLSGESFASVVNTAAEPRFSLKKPVEETKTLVALHNLTEEKLKKVLKLGGFPMPSIAVTRTDIPHTNFGDITLVMDKRSIDPKADRKNTVYSADAWTPTFPTVEYEADAAAENRIAQRLNRLSSKVDEMFRQDLYRASYDMSDLLNRYGGERGLVGHVMDNYGLKAAYLEEQGQHISPVMTQREADRGYSEAREDKYRAVADVLGVSTGAEVGGLNLKALREQYGDALEQVFPGMTKSAFRMSGILRQVQAYLDDQGGEQVYETVTDGAATRKAVDDALNMEEYERWVRELFSGIEGDSGISNNRELYTPSGNRRSFRQTHYPVTLENIVKAMAGQNGGNTKNVAGFYGVKTLRAGMARRFKSIADMHNLENRLQNLTEEEFEAIHNQLQDRMLEMINRIIRTGPESNENSLGRMDSVGEILMEIADSGRYTVDSIEKAFAQYRYKVGNQLAMDIRDLLFDVSQMPVNLFEAKPQRAVGFDEVLAAVVPSGSSRELTDALAQAGVRTLEYRAGDEADRLEKVNSVEGARFSLKGQKELERENAKLRETVAGLREQFRRTKLAKVDRKALDAFTKTLLKDYQSGADVEETRAALDSLYTYLANGENGEGPVWGEAYRRAFETAADILEAASVTEDEVYRQYSRLRRYLREQKMHVPREMWSELDSAGGYNALRRAYMGRLSLSSKDGAGIDQVYQELSQMYPEFFDETEISNPADQLLRIAEVLDGLEPYEVNPYSANMRESASWLANDILERFYELPQAKPTFADKAEGRLTDQVIRDGKKLEKLRGQKNARIAQLIAENRQKVKETQAEERRKRMEAVREVKEHYKAKEARASESRKAQVLRAKITRHANELSQKLLRPNDQRHIPESLRGAVASLLEAINQESAYELDAERKRVKPGQGVDITKRTSAFRELKARYTEIAGQEGGSMVIDPALLGDASAGFTGNFDKVLGYGDTPLAEMNSEQLESVWEVLRAVEHSVTRAGRILSEAKFQETAEWAHALEEDTATRRSRKGRFGERIRIDLETPYTYFSHFGEAGHAIYRMLREAQDRQQIMVGEVQKAVGEIVDPKTVRELNRQTHDFTTERGDQLTLSTAQVMEVYELMKREQAQDHLMKGGIVQPEVKSRHIKRGTNAILLTADDLARITKTLTDEQKKIADALQKLTGGMLAEYGNEASMKAYGYQKFTGTDYWPIKSAREAVHSNVEKGGSNTRSIKNIGMAKAVMPHASNPLDISGIFKTFAAHAADMTDYAAWLCAMEDVNRLYNFQFRDAEGNRTGDTVRGMLDKVGGAGAQEYWFNLMEDIQNGIHFKSDSAFTNVMNRAIGNAKGAAVGANLRVIIQQPTAIMRAGAVLNPADMTKGLAKGVTGGSGWKKAVEHSAIAKRKAMGGFDISSPMQMSEILFNDKGKLQTFNDAMGKGAELGDAVTWGKIWNACEWAAMRKNPSLKPGSEAFYQAVDEIFTEVIDQTQVVDGVLQRSQTMRSGNALLKQATAFMGEPTMSLNILLRAYDNLRSETDPKKRGKAIKMFGRSAAALAANCAVNALAQSLVDALRDDDEDKEYWERFWAAFAGDSGEAETLKGKAWNRMKTGNLEDSLNPLQYIPIAKDLWSFAQGYDVTRADVDVLGDITKAFTAFGDSIAGDGKKTVAYSLKTLAQSVGKVFGVSAFNILRDVWGAVRSAAVETGNVALQYEMEKAIYKIDNTSNKGRFIDILYRAYRQGDRAVYDHIVEDMIENGIPASSIESGMRSRAGKDQGEMKVPDSFSSAVGIKPEKYTQEGEKRFSADDLSGSQYTVYAQARGDMLAQIIDDFQAHGFGDLDEETASELMAAAYKFAEENALETASNGVYDSDTKWVNKAQAAPQELDMSEAEYIRLMNEYSAASIGADGVYDAQDAGIDVELYLEFRKQAKDIKADKDKDGDPISGSREKKVKELAEQLVNNEKEYLYLMGTEYSSVRNSRKYRKYFGKQN